MKTKSVLENIIVVCGIFDNTTSRQVWLPDRRTDCLTDRPIPTLLSVYVAPLRASNTELKYIQTNRCVLQVSLYPVDYISPLMNVFEKNLVWYLFLISILI